MKNSESSNPKPKVNLKDIVDGKKMVEMDVFIVGDHVYKAAFTTKDQIATHADCIDCGVEFEKDYTHQRRCEPCHVINDNNNYLKLPLVEWDGKTPLCIWGDDKYFFSEDDIESYCDDNNLNAADLKLETCKETHFGQINIAEQFQDDLHDDWQCDGELYKLEKSLNDHLAKASTNTWVGAGKRVQL